MERDPVGWGLFVIVEALTQIGLIGQLNGMLHKAVARSPAESAWTVGIIAALAGNVANNLPVGPIAGSIASADHLPLQHLQPSAERHNDFTDRVRQLFMDRQFVG